MSLSRPALVLLLALSACKSPSETSGRAVTMGETPKPPAQPAAQSAPAAPASAGPPEPCVAESAAPPPAKPVRFSLSNTGGDRVMVFLERLSGKPVKIDPDVEPALKAAHITIANEGEVDPKAAVRMMVDALRSKGIEAQEGPREWQVRRAPK